MTAISGLWKETHWLGTEMSGVCSQVFSFPRCWVCLSSSAVTVADGIFVGMGFRRTSIAAQSAFPLLMLSWGGLRMIGPEPAVRSVAIDTSPQQIKGWRVNVNAGRLFVRTLSYVGSVGLDHLGFRAPCCCVASVRRSICCPWIVDYCGVSVSGATGSRCGLPWDCFRRASWRRAPSGHGGERRFALVNVVLRLVLRLSLGWGVFGRASRRPGVAIGA